MKNFKKKKQMKRSIKRINERCQKNKNENKSKNTKNIEIKSFVVMHVKFYTIKFIRIFAINFFDDFDNFLFKYAFRFSWIINYDFDIHVVNKTQKHRFKKKRNCTNEFMIVSNIK